MRNSDDAFDGATFERFGETAFFRSLLEHISGAVLTIDGTGTVIYANPAVRNVFGYAPGELVGESLLALVPPEFEDWYLDAFDRYLRTGERSFDWDGIELPGQRKDGRTVALEISFQEYEHEGEQLFAGVARDVTDRRAREQELERYETLVEAADDGIYQLDPSGRFVAVNDVIAEVTGYSRDELLGEHVSLVLDEGDVLNCVDVIRTQLATGERGDQPVEIDIHTADGRVRIGDLQLNVLVQDGDFRGTVGIVRDITEWKQDDAERQLLHATTRSIAEAGTTVDGLQAVIGEVCETTECAYGEAWVPTDDGSHLTCTSAAYAVSDALDRFKERSQVTEFGPDEGLLGRVWATKEPEWMSNVSAVSADVFPRVDAAAAVGLKAALGVPVLAEGAVVAVLALYTTTEKPRDDRLVELVSTVAANLGTLVQRKQQEDTLKRQREELARRRDELQSELEELFERVNDAFYALDTDWKFTYVNPRAEELLQRCADDLKGKTMWEEFPAAVDSTLQEQYETAMKTQESVVFEDYYGRLERWFEVRAYPSESGLSVYFHDVTGRKERQQALEKQNKRLESFASMLAHELRNPLQIAQIYHPQASGGAPDAADQVASALDRIERMIDILLVTAKGAESVIDREPFVLRDVARVAWDDVSTARADVVIDVAQTICADRIHVRHLFENLFRNAIEHGGEDVTIRVGDLPDGSADRSSGWRGGSTASSETGAEQSSASSRTGEARETTAEPSRSPREDEATGGSPDSSERGEAEARRGAKRTAGGFYVEDDGSGIPEEDREVVFEAGHTTDGDGIGLGLTFVAQLAETYGWEYRIVGNETGGTRFEFRGIDSAETNV